MKITSITTTAIALTILTACSSTSASPTAPTESQPSAVATSAAAVPSPSATEDPACVLNRELVNRLPILLMAPLDETEAEYAEAQLGDIKADLPQLRLDAGKLPESKPAKYYQSSLLGLDVSIALYLSALSDYVDSGMHITGSTRESVQKMGEAIDEGFHDTTLICDAQ